MYKVVKDFEDAVCQYTGAKYGIAVDSCTNALYIACKYARVRTVQLPKRTYVGVAQSIINAGGSIDFVDYDWTGAYTLEPYNIIDSARRFTSGMYTPGHTICCSFHHTKHLAIGRGGMLLTDDLHAAEWYRRARFDGRTEGIPPREETSFGWGIHAMLPPEFAARGLLLLSVLPKHNADLPEKNYPDLSKHQIFKPTTYEGEYGGL